jgi:hypothetical protein
VAVYQYVNYKRELAQVVVSGDGVIEVPPNDLTFFVARPEEEMEVYAKDPARRLCRLIESGTVSELASRVRPL